MGGVSYDVGWQTVQGVGGGGWGGGVGWDGETAGTKTAKGLALIRGPFQGFV